MANDLLSAGRFALQAGQREHARQLLIQLVRNEPGNGEGWYLLSQALDDPAQKQDCYNRSRAAGYQPQPTPPPGGQVAPSTQCPQCHTLNPPSANFCSRCRFSFRAPPPAAQVAPPMLSDAQIYPQMTILQRQYTQLTQEIAQLQQARAAYQREVVELEETALLQSFGLYKPRYALQSSEAYKARLDQIRAAQEAAVKAGKATSEPMAWTINGSAAEGARMVRDYTKLILRAFNNECETSINGVKFNNIESAEKRIHKAYETLNKLGSRMSIEIVYSYLDMKIQELYLAHEYQLKKQEEKEEQRRQREQLREEAKALKEIEEMKVKIQKEHDHFAKALATINEQIQRTTDEAEQQRLAQEKAMIQGKIEDIQHASEDVMNRERNTRAGYVYIISNVGAFGENVYKIGVTRRLDPQDRIDELGDASVPFGFDIHALIFSEDAPSLENALHRTFESRRLNMVNRRREFFNVTLEEIADVIRMHFKKPIELTPLAEAPEYRQSLLLREARNPSTPS